MSHLCWGESVSLGTIHEPNDRSQIHDKCNREDILRAPWKIKNTAILVFIVYVCFTSC